MPACLPEQLWKSFSGGRPSCRPSSRSSSVGGRLREQRATAAIWSSVARCDAEAIARSRSSRSSRARASGSAWIGFDDERMKQVSPASPASATTAPSWTATACTRCRASTIPLRRTSTTIGSTGAEPMRCTESGLCAVPNDGARPGSGPLPTGIVRNGHFCGANDRGIVARWPRRTPRHRSRPLPRLHALRRVGDDVFRDDLDRIVFLRELARARRRSEWRCLAYCLMTTHYHLILEVDDDALPFGMQALNFRYAVRVQRTPRHTRPRLRQDGTTRGGSTTTRTSSSPTATSS